VERQERFGPVVLDDALEAFGDLGDRLVPRHPLELAAALRADPTQRVEQSVGCVRTLVVVVHLGAQRALRDRVVLRATHGHGTAVVDRRDPGAAVLAVQRAAAPDLANLVHGAPHPPRRAARRRTGQE
jgi:hypothetical protein